MRDVLLAALTEREPDLTAHVHDVAALAIAVGQRLGLTPVELDEVARAAEPHDIGKVAIPDSILGKPGPLSEEEWAFMRRHTVIGERILLAAPTMPGVARLVRSHHGRLDGTGYPDRLSRGRSRCSRRRTRSVPASSASATRMARAINVHLLVSIS